MQKIQRRKRLTAAAVERIKPPANGRVDYSDQVFPGLRLRVTEKGAKSYALITRLHGRQIRVTLGGHPALSLAQAREAAREALRAVDRGEDPRAAKRRARQNGQRELDTFAAVADQFVERYAKPKNRSWRETRRILEREVLPHWGTRPIAEIGRRDVLDVLDRVMDRGTPYMANRLLAHIRKLFNWALERGIVDTSPVANVKAPGKETQRERVLSEDEIKALWAAWDQSSYPFGPMMKLLLVTAQRRHEVAKMYWRDVDLENCLWTIPREQTKADRVHEVPLSSLAVGLLECLPRLSGDHVFSGTGGGRPVSGFSRAKARVVQLSGITGWRLHDLRRTAGTNMARLGVPVHTIGRVLNHAQSGVTAIYDRYSYGEEKRRALEIWSHKLDSIIRQTPENVVDITEARI